MICAGCTAEEMVTLTLEGFYGGTVEVDLCLGCHSIWFDHRESLQLAPNATLQLFKIIHEHQAATPRPLVDNMKCPRCGEGLLLTRDLQRGTWFNYYRCPKNHGRQTPFFQFLKEKNLVRALTPRQLAELKTHVKVVRCSNCGAPVDLEKHATCTHCQSAISALDPEQVEKTLAQLRAHDEKRQNVDPNVAAKLIMDKLQGKAFYDRLDQRDTWTGRKMAANVDLLEVGIDALFRLFT